MRCGHLERTFRSFPDLQLVLGHMGELLPFHFGRFDQFAQSPSARAAVQKHSLSHYVRNNVLITTSGNLTPETLIVLTAYESMLLNPRLARDTLLVLAHLQARADEPWRDAEPGKILHELRTGELAGADLIPTRPTTAPSTRRRCS